jgi:hypothetical protein
MLVVRRRAVNNDAAKPTHIPVPTTLMPEENPNQSPSKSKNNLQTIATPTKIAKIIHELRAFIFCLQLVLC